MAKLDVGKAAFAGLGVIGRNPLAVLVWGLLLLVLGVLPIGLIIGPMIDYFGQIATMSPAEIEALETNPEAMQASMTPFISMMFIAQPLMLITGIVTRTLITAAVFRAMLTPADKAWFYLRVTARELWLGLVMIVLGVLGAMAVFALWILLIPLLLIGAMASPDNPGLFLAILLPLMLVGGAVMVWLLLRFSLALPMSFAESNFRLFESWKLTRGSVGRLFLVGLLLAVLLIAIEMVLIGIGIAVLVGLYGMHGDLLTKIAAAENPMVVIQGLWPWIAGITVFGCFLGAALMTLVMAPWAEAYRQLTAKAEPAAA